MTNPEPAASPPARPSPAEVEAVMLAAQLLVAVTAQSVAAVEPEISLPQLRVLIILASQGPQSLGAVARLLDIHPSNASRACDRLVQSGLLTRNENPVDRRQLRLELTGTGRRVIQSVMNHRRKQIEQLLARVPAADRTALTPALRALAAAGGETMDRAGLLSGWTTLASADISAG
jgi:DNA-binding MarR family transcriptional regulator